MSWQGVVLRIAKEVGTIPITYRVMIAIANRNPSRFLGWVLLAVTVAGYAGSGSLHAGRRRGGPKPQPIITGFVLRIAASVDALSRKRSLSTGL